MRNRSAASDFVPMASWRRVNVMVKSHLIREIEKSCTTKVAWDSKLPCFGAAIFDLGSSAARQQHERQAADHCKSP